MKVIKIYCSNCNTLLYKYKKDIRGHLIKCYKDMIITDNTTGNLKCPGCNQEFAREAIYHNRPANKIIQGKVFTKGT
jgi:DNA-directed RNA polymerase subunit M/transcription elongation factor TFIIS